MTKDTELELAIGWLRGDVGECSPERLINAADAIEKLSATIEEMEGALKSASSWLERWGSHVGNCGGGHVCTCGLTAISHEAETALSNIRGSDT